MPTPSELNTYGVPVFVLKRVTNIKLLTEFVKKKIVREDSRSFPAVSCEKLRESKMAEVSDLSYR
jgi:hypothetical protein